MGLAFSWVPRETDVPASRVFRCIRYSVREMLASQPESNRSQVLAGCIDNPKCSHKPPR